jgi:SAM-dependent methyltransferase
MHQVARDLPEYEWFRGVMPSWDNSARRGSHAHILVGSSPERYEEWLRRIVFQTSLRRKIDEPLIFVNAWNEWAEGTHLEPDTLHGYDWLKATQRALRDGTSKYHELVRQAVARAGYDPSPGEATAIARATPSPPADRNSSPAEVRPDVGERGTITSGWFSEADIELILRRYATYSTEPLGYATVEDFVDSYEHLRPLASAQGDLKDVQRPWAVKAVLSNVPRGGRILEIGAGQPFVADLLARCGYDVWVVDPYDGSGNGPVEFEKFRDASPAVTFVRDDFSDGLDVIEPFTFDCVYSISVLEHIDENGLNAVMAGMLRAMKATGVSIHAVDHVLRGNGSGSHLARLGYLMRRHGWSSDVLESVLSKAMDDPETYFLSAESHNRWRGDIPYRDFPMRTCISVQVVARTGRLRRAEAAHNGRRRRVT